MVSVDDSHSSGSYAEATALLAREGRPKEWLSLPYGMWVNDDGSRVLFDRRYRPLLRRVDDRIEVMRGDEWINGPGSTVYLYNDACSPSRDRETRARCERVVASWALLLWEPDRPRGGCLGRPRIGRRAGFVETLTETGAGSRGSAGFSGKKSHDGIG